MDDYIIRQWGVNYTHPKYDYYIEFIRAVAGISYDSMHLFEQFIGDESLKDVDMLDLAAKVHPQVSGVLITFETERDVFWKLIMTENGMCFTINSKFTDLFSFE